MIETTFISIHDLTEEAVILYSSDSVVDILGYTPDEIVNRSAWDFFSLEELPIARQFHKKRVANDKAAVLGYCRIKDKSGAWRTCECCFSIVYDVMVVCTSIYQSGASSKKRASEAPLVRRLFSSSPKDPRYHMLSHLSAKFAPSIPMKVADHEPRAALFLNRFTRTLTIMYATSGLQDVIGIPAEAMRGRSFYYCIAQNCLQDAVKCLENAKGNDSIAYLRFWFRDPRIDDEPPTSEDSDEEMTTDTSEGGVDLQGEHESTRSEGDAMDVDVGDMKHASRHSSGESSTRRQDTHEAIFGEARDAESSASSSPDRDGLIHDPIELEAVVSCTSDGLVVCLRKARPMIPHPTSDAPARSPYTNGLFAAPWALEPVLPPLDIGAGIGFGTASAPSLAPQGARRNSPAVGAVEHSSFMNAIREQAVFAWALTGINGMLAAYGEGKPVGESVPDGGFPVWADDPRNHRDDSSTGYNSGQDFFGSANKSPRDLRPSAQMFGDPGLGYNSSGSRGMGSGSGSNSTGGTPYPGSR
jgi:PAS domain S-box-containing protein